MVVVMVEAIVVLVTLLVLLVSGWLIVAAGCVALAHVRAGGRHMMRTLLMLPVLNELLILLLLLVLLTLLMVMGQVHLLLLSWLLLWLWLLSLLLLLLVETCHDAARRQWLELVRWGPLMKRLKARLFAIRRLLTRTQTFAFHCCCCC